MSESGLVQVVKCVMLCDLVVIDMDEFFDIPITLGMTYLLTRGKVIDILGGGLSF